MLSGKIIKIIIKKKEKKKEAMLDVDGLIKVGGYMV
jgi:hypothetical protein